MLPKCIYNGSSVATSSSVLFLNGFGVGNKDLGSEFSIVSSTLEEPVWVSEELKEYKIKQSEDIFLRLTQ